MKTCKHDRLVNFGLDPMCWFTKVQRPRRSARLSGVIALLAAIGCIAVPSRGQASTSQESHPARAASPSRVTPRGGEPESAVCVAFSAFQPSHTSFSNHDVVDFSNTLLSVGGGWNGTTFTAPATGIYYFSLGFVRDSYYQGGTQDDVFLFLVHNNVDVGYAWAGESDWNEADAKRMTGAFSILLDLQVGDIVKAASGSDGGTNRHMMNVFLNGVRVSSSTSGVAFSAFQPSHTSFSNHDVVDFASTSLTVGGGWNGTTFTAPSAGLYYFSLGFVRDSYYQGGTQDDANLFLVHNNVDVGYAWAGESDWNEACAKRMTGAYSTLLDLQAGDVVKAATGSDGGTNRHMMNVYMNGMRLTSSTAGVGFSAFQPSHTSFSNHDVVDFASTSLAVGGGWNGTTFTAPSAGIYYFSLGFVRDSYYQGGTQDDANLYLVHNNVDVGYAWAGESDWNEACAKRMTGAYSVLLDLQAGDIVKAATGSDGGTNRHMMNVYMNGALLSCGDGGGGGMFVYCAAKMNSLGCLPAIDWTGTPSATSGSGFVVTSVNVRNNKPGLLFYGTNGQAAMPFSGGTLCIKSPIRRTGAVNSGGSPLPANDCSGVYSIDMNAFAISAGPPVPQPDLLVPGTVVDCQFWGRDPGFPSPNNTSLTDALEYTVGP
jgi:hypothetical protein